MQIIIEMPDAVYQSIKDHKYLNEHGVIREIVLNGTPLPKGHGRLIDADELTKIIQENDVLYMRGFNVRVCDIDKTLTIIKADKTESEE